MYDPKVSDCHSIHTTDKYHNIMDFTTLYYASILGLGRLDFACLRQLCVFDDEDVVDAPVGGGAYGDSSDDGTGGGAFSGGGQGSDGVRPSNVQAG
ncbi:unnamed protein product [Lactuca saligna]|uniref:Uncharacterized protein n=1 Tax=Lactuca saligna TaxID=75948 RepID=A0AA35VUI3_LACSI|nr:unnamed protein product [Lactuca saligna]